MSQRLWPLVAPAFPLSLERRAVPGRYAAWWTTPSDPDARTSTTVAAIEQTLKMCATRLSYMIADFFEQFGVVEPGTLQMVPPKELGFVARLPSGHVAVLSISQEQGWLWKFDTSTPPDERDVLWHLTATWATTLDAILTKHEATIDPPEYCNAAGWWAIQRALIDGEFPESGPVQAVAITQV